MKANVGGFDRILRIITGLIFLGAGYYLKSWWGLAGILPIMTGLFRFCPAYLPLGVSTCAKEDKK